jgi:hypothetical protein
MINSRPLTTSEYNELLKLRNEIDECRLVGHFNSDYEFQVARRDELIAIETANREAESLAAWGIDANGKKIK